MITAFHVHTNYSACSESAIDDIASYCRSNAIDGIAITDHNLIEGALKMRETVRDVKVIIGEEVSTRDGEIIGLFLNEKIEPGLDLRDTCFEIKRQGGLVYLPHPFDKFKVHRVRRRHLAQIIDLVDIVEVFNAKISFSLYNRRAKKFAEESGKIAAVGSDSHYVSSIGSALAVMDPFYSPQDFLEKLSRAEFRIKMSSLLFTWWVRARKAYGMD